jgi:hypothetical protein
MSRAARDSHSHGIKTDVIPAKRRIAAREPGPTQTAGSLFKIELGFTVGPGSARLSRLAGMTSDSNGST